MLAVSLDRRWGVLAYLAAACVIAATFTFRAGFVFALFTGLLGMVSGLVASAGGSWRAAWLLSAAAMAPALAALVALVPGFVLYGFRPNPSEPSGMIYLLFAAALLGLSWTMTAMLAYPRIVRAVRRGLTP